VSRPRLDSTSVWTAGIAQRLRTRSARSGAPPAADIQPVGVFGKAVVIEQQARLGVDMSVAAISNAPKSPTRPWSDASRRVDAAEVNAAQSVPIFGYRRRIDEEARDRRRAMKQVRQSFDGVSPGKCPAPEASR